jgi:N-glycosidase YbiA
MPTLFQWKHKMTIYFYRVSEIPYGYFSNFSPHGFELDGIWWPTSKHYFQAQKVSGTPLYQKILETKSPMRAAELGRDRRYPIRADWDAVKDGVMKKAVKAKFEAHPEIRAILLGTGSDLIVEKTTQDYYWGCGSNGNGMNRLGQILMEVRGELQTEQNLWNT